MTRQHHCVPVIRKYILHLLLKSAGRYNHRLVSEIVQALFPCPRPGNATLPRYVERKIISARLQIAIDIAAEEIGVGFTNDLLKSV